MIKFKKLDDELFGATLLAWTSQAANLGDIGLLLEKDIKRKLSWALEHNNGTDTHTYCLLNDAGEYAISLVEISHVLPSSVDNSRLKLLDITMEPNLNFEFVESPSEEVLKDCFLALSESIVESLILTYDELPANGLKLYGRTNRMVGMFDRIVTSGSLDTTLEKCGLGLKQENKWLVIYKK